MNDQVRHDPANAAPEAPDRAVSDAPARAAPEARDSAGDVDAAGALGALERERDEYRDRWMRKAAEFDNYRKRVERERREQSDQALVDLLLELLLVVDDFERALAVGNAETDAYRKGVELIYTKLHELLRKYGVEPIEALGRDFDPTVHQAVLHEVSPGHREGEVIDELRRGYMINGRLLRPAMVKVAKA
jgi:molecular chaperone GrpE